MPQCVEVERAVLGACMIGGADALDLARAELSVEAFYHTAHRAIFRAMCDLAEDGKPHDQVMLIDELQGDGKLEEAGGPAYLAALASEMATAANIRYHAGLVLEAWQKRRYIIHAQEQIALAYDAGTEIVDLAGHADRAAEIATGGRSDVWVRLGDVIGDVADAVERAVEDPGSAMGVPSGLADLDYQTLGFHGGDLVIVAARPSMGKTALALDIARHAAKNKGPVGFVSAEMTVRALVHRALSTESRLDSHKMRSGEIGREGVTRVRQAEAGLREVPMYITEKASRPAQIGVEMRKLKREHDICLGIVDYLQLLDPDEVRRDSNREREVAAFTRSLKRLALALGIPIIALSQLSRAVEHRQNKRPQLSDLRDSGSIEQDADLALFLYRGSVYGDKDEDGAPIDSKRAEIIIGKQRNGPTPTVDVLFDPATGRWMNLERVHGQAELVGRRESESGWNPDRDGLPF